MKILASGCNVVLLAMATLWVVSPCPSAAEVNPPAYYEDKLDAERGTNGPSDAILPIQFPTNSAEITRESAEELKSLAIALNGERLRSSRFRIEGHTDSAGLPAYNLSLSERRAKAVKQYLVGLGVGASRLEAQGFGASRPIPGVAQDTEEGRAANRRVVIVRGSGAPVAPTKEMTSKTSGKPLVSVTVTYQHGGAVEVLKEDATLRPHDNYRVTFTPDRNSYVYIFQFDETGKVDRLFPGSYSPATNPVKSNWPSMVPPEGSWLWLDDTVGRQEIVVLASRTELADAETMARSVSTVRGKDRGFTIGGSVNAPPPLSRPPPSDVFSYRLPFRTQGP